MTRAVGRETVRRTARTSETHPDTSRRSRARRFRVRALPEGASRALPAIALSAYASADDRRRALDAGYHLHISKPYDGEDLVAACIKVLRLLPL